MTVIDLTFMVRTEGDRHRRERELNSTWRNHPEWTDVLSASGRVVFKRASC
jgi:ssRNA-specific RNase YbeY (16S rRNA maturation enzyme)